MRLFIAIDLEESIKNKLNYSIDILKQNSISGNFTPRENLHLTLVFIGETNHIEAVQKAINDTVSSISLKSFVLTMSGTGTFKRREGDIYWVGVEKEKVLWNLQSTLSKDLGKAGFKIEEREFVPHLTLGRKVKVKEEFSKQQFRNSIGTMSMKVGKVSLMKSESVGNRQVYTEVYKVEF